MNHQQGIVQLAITIIIALLIGGGGFLLVQQDKVEKEENEKAVNALIEQSKNSPKLEDKDRNDETVGWKTYTNTKVGYSISYPASYHVAYENDLFNYDETKYEVGGPMDGVKIQIQSANAPLFDVDVPLGRQKFIDSLNQSIKNGTVEYPETVIQPISLNQIKYKNSMLTGPGGVFDIYYAFPEDSTHNLQKNNSRYFRILVWDGSNDKENVEKILSTFKFTK